MSRRSKGRRRVYQPLPRSQVNWGARLLIVVIGFVMVAGIAILTFAR